MVQFSGASSTRNPTSQHLWITTLAIEQGKEQNRHMTTDNGYASEGAVRQDGPLAVKVCKNCDSPIVWAKSRKSGKNYPVNVTTGYLGQRFYMKNNFHNCEQVMAQREAIEASATKAEQVAAQHRSDLTEIQAITKECKASGTEPKNDPRILAIFNRWDTDGMN